MTDKSNKKENPISTLDNDVSDVINRAIEEQDPQKVKDLTSLFNMHMNKKNMIRLVKLNDLLDNVVDQSLTRFESNPNNFSNKELIDYMNVVQKTSDASFNQLKEINEAPATIQINNQTAINVGCDKNDLSKLSKESRKRVLDAIDSILKNSTTSDVIDVEVIDKETNEDI